jgi:predicted PurR-regulated permease PerM
MTKYPTPWQRKIMWASLSAFFVVVLFLIVGTVVFLSANLIAFLQPILIPVAIAAILAYLLDPVVTHLAARGFGRTKAVLTIFAIAFLGIVALCAWIVPLISVQSASLARKLPAFTEQTRDRVVDLSQTDLRRSAANPGLGAKATARDRETTARSHCQAVVTVQDQHWRLPRRHRVSP